MTKLKKCDFNITQNQRWGQNKKYQQNAKSQIATKPKNPNSQKLKTQMIPKLKHLIFFFYKTSLFKLDTTPKPKFKKKIYF